MVLPHGLVTNPIGFIPMGSEAMRMNPRVCFMMMYDIDTHPIANLNIVCVYNTYTHIYRIYGHMYNIYIYMYIVKNIVAPIYIYKYVYTQ